MQIINLASGSKGNCTLVVYGETKILIDAGLSYKKLCMALEEVGSNISEIGAVCVTHEHIDHIRGIEQLAKKQNIVVFLHERLAAEPNVKGLNLDKTKIQTFSDNSFEFAGLEIHPFCVSHDAIRPVGFTLNATKSKSKVAFVTDLGEANENVKSAVAGSKVVFIESNYDENMLFEGFYPPEVKSRIASKYGHLSNSQSLEFAKFLFECGTKCFVLSHISENNNTYELAFSNYKNYFESQKIDLNKDLFLRMNYQNQHGSSIVLKEEF